MPRTIRAPFNFVPLNDKVYIPEWWNQVSQDIPFSDGEDGVIDVEIINLSPLFVRDGHGHGNKTNFSAHIIENDEKRYFIPATSIKGMLRSVMEILSFSKLLPNQFTDSYIGYRTFGGNSTDGGAYTRKMENVKSGWLVKKGNDFILYPCLRDFVKVPINAVKEQFREYDKGSSSWENNSKLKYPIVSNDGQNWKLVCTGYIDGKKKEYLFSEETKKGIVLSKEVIDKFITVYDPTPNFKPKKDSDDEHKKDGYLNWLYDGKTIAVFYLEENNGNIDSIGLSKMMRFPYKYNVGSIVRKQQKSDSRRDLCEVIWGNVNSNDDSSIKGRIQICNAFCTEIIDDSQLCGIKGVVLGSPRASYYPLYLKQTQQPYKDYNSSDALLSGRKRYRIHEENIPDDDLLPQGNENEKTKSHFNAVPANKTFKFQIRFHNLRKVEIGALLSALTFHNTDGTYHNIGAVKSFGYGKVKVVNNIRLSNLKYDMMSYLSAFELEMERFTKENLRSPWIDSEQLKTLFAIARGHEKNELKMMTLEEYGEAKKNNNFSWLTENFFAINSSISDKERLSLRKDNFKRDNAELFDNLKMFIQEQKYEDAQGVLRWIVNKGNIAGVDVDEEEQMLQNIGEKIKQKQEKEDYIRKQREEEEKRKKLEAGLGTQLESKFEFGPNVGKFKIQGVKRCMKEIESWLKKCKRKELNDQEKADFILTLRRLRNECKDKNEQKAWTNYESGSVWLAIRKYINDESLTKQFFDEK